MMASAQVRVGGFGFRHFKMIFIISVVENVNLSLIPVVEKGSNREQSRGKGTPGYKDSVF